MKLALHARIGIWLLISLIFSQLSFISLHGGGGEGDGDGGGDGGGVEGGDGGEHIVSRGSHIALQFL
jgi:hypothetical protein